MTTLKPGADEKLLQMIKALNQGEQLEQYLNIDQILRYFAVNTVLVNLDSYVGQFKHNYYLYEENGIFTILPWDYNMSFGGFGMGGAIEQRITAHRQPCIWNYFVPTTIRHTRRPQYKVISSIFQK